MNGIFFSFFHATAFIFLRLPADCDALVTLAVDSSFFGTGGSGGHWFHLR